MPFNNPEAYFRPEARAVQPTGPRFSLNEILGDFSEDYQSVRDRQAGLEDEFLQMLRTPTDYSALRGEVGAMAEGLTNQLFGAGGAVELATRDALGGSVQSGFGPSSGGFDAARMNILGQAAGSVADTVAQGALQLAPIAEQRRASDIGAMGAFTQSQAARGDSFLESMFGGQATLEQLGLANQQFDLNKRLVEESLRKSKDSGGFWSGLGKFAGLGLGAIAGPAFGAIGGAFGDKAVDWLGLGDDTYNPFTASNAKR